MKYQCIVPILVDKLRVRVDDVVDADIAEAAGEHKDKYFVPVTKAKAAPVAEQPMTISDIAKAKQYAPPVGRRKAQ